MAKTPEKIDQNNYPGWDKDKTVLLLIPWEVLGVSVTEQKPDAVVREDMHA